MIKINVNRSFILLIRLKINLYLQLFLKGIDVYLKNYKTMILSMLIFATAIPYMPSLW